MISARWRALLRRARSWYWPDPYARHEPEPLQTLPELTGRVRLLVADLRDMNTAADMNRSTR